MPSPWTLSPRHTIPLDRPRFMGILNATPDSFADGGRHLSADAALAAALQMIDEGADAIDIGGESTRPGSARVPPDEQLRRVIPIIDRLRRASSVPITIDTTSAEVARAALDAGADAINDVSGGLDSSGGTIALAAERRAGLILMHRLAPPERDSYSDRYATPPAYQNVVEDVRAALDALARNALSRGVPPASLVLDPGLGFGKSVEQNIALLDATPRLASLGFPILSALSRKSFVGRHVLGRDSTPDERLDATLALSLRHARADASIFRVHDVGAHVTAFREAGLLAGG